MTENSTPEVQEHVSEGAHASSHERPYRKTLRGFVVSDHADWPSLLRTAHETGARRVIATHGDTDALVRVLNTQGINTGVFATGYGEDD